MSDTTRRRLRAALRNAIAWGAAWAAAGGAIVAAIGLFDPDPRIESLPERVGLALLAGVAWGLRFGIAGGVIGSAFSVVLGLRYRGRRLAEIDPLRFALLGAVVGGAGVPLYLQTMNVLIGGGPIAWGLVGDDALWAAPFGAAAAAASILLARRAGTSSDASDGDDHLDGGEEAAELLGAGTETASAVPHVTRAGAVRR